MPARFAKTVAVVVVLWSLSGCGGSSSSDQTAAFKSSFSSAANQFRTTSQAIGTAIEQAPSRTDAQLAAEFRDLAQRWQGDLTRLEALKAPASVAGPFNTMSAAATRAEADLKAIAAAVQGHNTATTQQGSTRLVADILAAKSASTTITNKLGTK
jgi:hypothetical protein